MKDTEAEFITLTPEYLFDKGIKYYKKALDVQSKMITQQLKVNKSTQKLCYIYKVLCFWVVVMLLIF